MGGRIQKTEYRRQETQDRAGAGGGAAGVNKKENIQYSTRNFQCPGKVPAVLCHLNENRLNSLLHH
jgi:hypothetical protein